MLHRLAADLLILDTFKDKHILTMNIYIEVMAPHYVMYHKAMRVYILTMGCFIVSRWWCYTHTNNKKGKSLVLARKAEHPLQTKCAN